MSDADQDQRMAVLDDDAGGEYNAISERLWEMNQSWYYKFICFVGADDAIRKLRVDIRRNAHDFQSHAKVSVWDGDKWQFVTGMPMEECECRVASYVIRPPDPRVGIGHFRKDAMTLIREAKAVVL